ncbi:MAG: DUF2065 domain-containing protein [Methylophilaceae bacterium]
MKTTFLTAFGLMLILEGVLPFLAPKAWRQTFQRMIELKDGQLRFVGLASMLVGLILMFVLY